MNILITGQCTLHWGRMEFGNIGNYYIIEPFFRELRRVFPVSEIKTTFQMSNRFCIEESVSILPMELYYGWNDKDLEQAREEVVLARQYQSSGELPKSTPYIEEVLWADLIVDFSGDIWGDNADFLGADRFEVGLLKNKTAQLFGKKTVMLAGSPGPFANPQLKKMAKDVYGGFDLVTNREPLSTHLLEQEGFDCSNTLTLACPAFLFEPASEEAVAETVKNIYDFGSSESKPIVGFIMCGWNFEEGPFDKWPREDKDYDLFAEAVEFISKEIGARVCLMSHSNGFDIPPETFRLKHGRDYPVIKQLQNVIEARGIAKDVIALDGIYGAWETKAIIKSFDMLVSGRVHAAVAALSQNVPTVVVDYGHEPKAHKLKGFATIAGVEEFVVDPSSPGALKAGIMNCWNRRDQYRKLLNVHIPSVKKQAKTHFDLLKSL
jgi:colanic acid/amylovoran biosynthesis protein